MTVESEIFHWKYERAVTSLLAERRMVGSCRAGIFKEEGAL